MKKIWLFLSAALAVVLASGVIAAEPVLSIDFADGDNGMELVDSELVEDSTRGQVLQVSGMGPGTTGQSYAVLETKIFEETNWDDGMTVNMWVKSDVGSSTLHGTAPIFSLDIANVGYIALTTSLESAINTDGNDTSLGISPRIWTDPANVSGGLNKTEEGVWQYISVVYCEDHIEVYVDGELYSDHPFGNGNAADLSSMLNLFVQYEYVYSLRLGSWLCSWWNYGDFEGMIDDVTIYNTALTADEISGLYSSTAITQTEFEKAPSLEELYTATYVEPIYTLDFSDASSVELVNAEITTAERGEALKVNGTGDGTNGTSYGLVKTDLFANTDWSKGMTVSLWVKADSSDTLKGNAPLYSFDISNQGYIAVVASLESGINTTGNEAAEFEICWNDPSNVGGSVPAVKAGEWQNVTVVYGEKDMAIYLNGELQVKPGVNGAGMAALMDQMKYVPSLRLGSWLCSWWQQGDFEGLIDDVVIYNTALNPLEVKQAYTKTGAFGEGAAAETVTEPETVDAAAPETTVEAAETTTAATVTETKAAQTFDGIIIAAAAAVISLGTAVVCKKRR
ncbi:MAG: LamG-like jellyroll fold domain-containing protein [Eubacteriales bacterium]